MAVTRLRKQAMDAEWLSYATEYIAAAASGAGQQARIILATFGRSRLNWSHVGPPNRRSCFCPATADKNEPAPGCSRPASVGRPQRARRPGLEVIKSAKVGPKEGRNVVKSGRLPLDLANAVILVRYSLTNARYRAAC